MIRTHVSRATLPALAVAAVLAAATPASAVECAALQNPVYVAGSSAFKPVLKKAAELLAAQNPPITIVYQSGGSCVGVDAILNGTKQTSSAKYWDASGTEVGCDQPAGGISADIGVSDVYPQVCPNVTGLPADKADWYGPVQVMTIVAPLASTENSISAEAAYMVFGFGGAAPNAVAPWDTDQFLFIRNDSSGTKNMIAKAIGLPVAKWKGQVQGGSGDVATKVSTSTSPNQTLGILAADYTDSRRTSMKVLAFKAKDQLCGYYPDSTANSFDKLNVREGRYAIWGALHLVTGKGANGRPVPALGNPAGGHVDTVIKFFSHEGLAPAQEQQMIEAEAAAFTVPQCAMEVTRDEEVGPMMSFQPDRPCGCFFEKLKTGENDCVSCTSDAQCSGATPKCRFGFCEAK